MVSYHCNTLWFRLVRCHRALHIGEIVLGDILYSLTSIESDAVTASARKALNYSDPGCASNMA